MRNDRKIDMRAVILIINGLLAYWRSPSIPPFNSTFYNGCFKWFRIYSLSCPTVLFASLQHRINKITDQWAYLWWHRRKGLKPVYLGLSVCRDDEDYDVTRQSRGECTVFSCGAVDLTTSIKFHHCRKEPVAAALNYVYHRSTSPGNQKRKTIDKPKHSISFV